MVAAVMAGPLVGRFFVVLDPGGIGRREAILNLTKHQFNAGSGQSIRCGSEVRRTQAAANGLSKIWPFAGHI